MTIPEQDMSPPEPEPLQNGHKDLLREYKGLVQRNFILSDLGECLDCAVECVRVLQRAELEGPNREIGERTMNLLRCISLLAEEAQKDLLTYSADYMVRIADLKRLVNTDRMEEVD